MGGLASYTNIHGFCTNAGCDGYVFFDDGAVVYQKGKMPFIRQLKANLPVQCGNLNSQGSLEMTGDCNSSYGSMCQYKCQGEYVCKYYSMFIV